MTLPRPAASDALRPTAEAALAAWTARVDADHKQVERCREVADPSDFYAPVATRFRPEQVKHPPQHAGHLDPRRREDVLAILRGLARPDDEWLDIGAGGGRYALPLALDVAHVIAVDPSPAMLGVLANGMREHAIANITSVEARWPTELPADTEVDVALMAHVGYDIGAIGPFLAAAEKAASRLCVAVMGEGAMTTASTLFWEPVHGEPRVALPALPELIALLVALGRLPEVSLARRSPPTFATFDELLAMARRQLWVRAGSPKDATLEALVRAQASERDAGWSLDWTETRIGVAAWTPPRDD
jgi:SAM-dependent methyltransferase